MGHGYPENLRIDKEGKKHCRKCDNLTRSHGNGSVPAVRGDGQLLLDLDGRITEVALIIRPGMPMSSWAAIGPRLAKTDKWINFALGDWLNYGADNYPEEYAQAVSELPYTPETIQMLMYVAKKVPEEVRRKEFVLSWYHHRLVAKLDHAEQASWLAKALKNEWSIMEMKEAMAPEPASLVEPEGDRDEGANGNGDDDRERSCECCGRAPAPSRTCGTCMSVAAAALPIGMDSALSLLKSKPSKPQKELLQWAFEQINQPDFEGWQAEDKANWESHFSRLTRAAGSN